MKLISATACLTLIAVACATTTQLESSWRDPAAQPYAFHRVLVSFVTTDVALRNATEDKLAQQIPGSFPAYRSLPDLSIDNATTAKQQLRNKLYDGVLMMRVVDVDNAAPDKPGSHWYGSLATLNASWAPSWAMVNSSGYAVNNRMVTIETLAYSVGDEKLLFAARTQSEKPSDINGLLDKAVNTIANEMRNQQLVR